MGDPLPDPRQPLPASLPLCLCWFAEAQRVARAAHRAVAGLPIGRLCGHLRARQPDGEKQVRQDATSFS